MAWMTGGWSGLVPVHGWGNPYGKGVCMAANNRVTVLADTVERPEEVDVNRAKEALERAQARLRQKQSIQEYHTTQAAMARALTRLKETEKFLR